MKFLLDTNALLFWLSGSTRLNARILDRLTDPANVVYVSAVSAFEIAVKASLGRLKIAGDPAEVVPPFLDGSGLAALPVSMRHAFGVYALPRYHDDPFDRLLISQALVEDLTLVSSDRELAKYGVKMVLVP